MMWWLLILQLIVAVAAQFHFMIPIVQQKPVLQRRPGLIRTNCCSPCLNQNRCRWNQRPNVPVITGPVPVISPQPVHPPDPPQPANSTSSTTVYPTLVTTAVNTTSELPTQPTTGSEPVTSSSGSNFLRPTKKMRPDMMEQQGKPDQFINPCSIGKPLLNAYEAPISCNFMVEPNGGCPDDYWCHTGATFATTVCCPINDKESRCSQPHVIGEGDEVITRWYFDIFSKQCKRFLYKGKFGNANNFLSKAQCQAACATETGSSSGDPNPCRYGVPALGQNQNKLICGPVDSSQCPKGHYCHIGENPATTACCEGSGCMLKRFHSFYYEVNEKRCKKFIYKGIRGNENNFLTMEECEDECIKSLNICLLPLINGERKECNNDDQCASGQWCHLGSSRLTSVCCRGAVSNPCTLPLETGDGSENITRWFSDPSDNSCNRQCTPFIYKGSRGNQNNFLSKEECEKRCKPVSNPCTLPLETGDGSENITRWFSDPSDNSCNRQCTPFIYKGSRGNQNNFLSKEECEKRCKPGCTNVCGNNSVLLDSSGKPRRCGPSSPCPNEYWCHIGGDDESTLCCSGTGDICKQPLARGVGEYHLTRWHFSNADNKCISFIYRGIGGNQNMFLTVDDCRISCPSYENPCGSGEPLMVDDRPKLCSPDSRCPSTHFCHIGADDAPNYCCPKDGDPCGLHLAEGSGRFFISRYYFDKETRRCHEFAYRGQKGNANNFLTKEDC
uniref:Kunitz/Bovine pancreatic trypsin inhibitor domain protein n=1 Tax=Ascaris lumbricoides TaxID=6252 RepID=A0A0M3I7C9_ASCLU